MNKKILIGLAAIALLAVMMPNAFALDGCPPGLTPGFWKHNVGVYLTSIGYDDVNVPGSYSDPVGATGVTKDNMGTWLSNFWTDAQLYQLWLEMSTIGGGAEGAATRNTAANWFNGMAGLESIS